MTPTFQIAVDCVDPHRLARFWAEAVGYAVEDNEEQIRQLLGLGIATDADVAEFDGRLVWATAAACRHPQGAAPRLLFQAVPEPKAAKNRLHLDLQFGPEHRDEQATRLIALGATKLWDGQQGPHQWVTLADPEGNEFCVS